MKDEEKIEIKEGAKDEPVVTSPQIRQIIIETDGNDISIIKAEVPGKIELVAIFQTLIAFLTKPTPNGTESNSGKNK